jgi:hypothetical protein
MRGIRTRSIQLTGISLFIIIIRPRALGASNRNAVACPASLTPIFIICEIGMPQRLTAFGYVLVGSISTKLVYAITESHTARSGGRGRWHFS